MRRARSGDTIVEVILAFGVFALLAAGTTVVMNRGLSMGQRSLERTLVRQQVDSQAELLRYTRNNLPTVWKNITDETSGATVGDTITDYETCPTTIPARSFVINIDGGNIRRQPLSGSSYQPASYHSKVNYGNSAPYANGLWIVSYEAGGSESGGKAYDMHIHACWDSVGGGRPLVVSTIVRLYDT